MRFCAADGLDSRPTSASHARSMRLEEAPEAYRSRLFAKLTGGEAPQRIVFSPAQSRKDRAYLLALLPDRLLYLEQLRDGEIRVDAVPFSEICAVCETRDLLMGIYGVYWRDGTCLRMTRIAYNRARQDLYAPVLNAMLGCEAAFDAVQSPCEDRPQALLREQYGLYSYAGELYRLGAPAGAAANIVLDPLFIFVFRWGMMGAAVATVIGQLITAALSVWYLLHMRTIRPSRTDLRPNKTVCGRTLLMGGTSFFSQISLVAAMAAINNMLRQYGALDPIFGQPQYAQIPMAVVGIVMKFFQIVISIVVGTAAGCIPIVGFNMGANRKARVRALFTRLLLVETTVGLVALFLSECCPHQLIAIFGAAQESEHYTAFAVRAFRIYLCMVVLACVNKACFIFLQAMGKTAESTALSMVREVVFGVGFALLLPRFFGLDGVLYSMPVSDVLTFAVSAVLIARTYRELRA